MKVIIKKADKGELDILNKELSSKVPNFHEKKIQEQENGDSLWLIAWKDGVPVGHLQIRFKGTTENEVTKYIKNTPYVEAVGVNQKYRRQGIATALMERAEKLVKENGHKQIGLAVGYRDNPGAKILYENLGYKDWGHGTYTVSWKVKKNGKVVTETEECVYFLKNLTH